MPVTKPQCGKHPRSGRRYLPHELTSAVTYTQRSFPKIEFFDKNGCDPDFIDITNHADVRQTTLNFLLLLVRLKHSRVSIFIVQRLVPIYTKKHERNEGGQDRSNFLVVVQNVTNALKVAKSRFVASNDIRGNVVNLANVF